MQAVSVLPSPRVSLSKKESLQAYKASLVDKVAGAKKILNSKSIVKDVFKIAITISISSTALLNSLSLLDNMNIYLYSSAISSVLSGCLTTIYNFLNLEKTIQTNTKLISLADTLIVDITRYEHASSITEEQFNDILVKVKEIISL